MSARAAARRGAVFAVMAATRVLAAQQDLPPDKLAIGAAVRADLTKLTELERAWFASHQRYTDDIRALNFISKSGAQIAVSYASARTFSASASHMRLAPFICFSIVSTPGVDSPADKPFCTDARYGTAASALARSGTQSPAPAVAPARAPAATSARSPAAARAATPANMPQRIEKVAPPASTIPNVIPVTPIDPTRMGLSPNPLTTAQFADQLRRSASAALDSIVIVVQFAVKDARYDPSRGVLEIVLERVPLPFTRPQPPDTGTAQIAFECHARPAFVCGKEGMTYIARDLWRVPQSRAPGAEALRSGLTVQARFEIGRRDFARGPALTLVALLLQANGINVSRWDAAQGH